MFPAVVALPERATTASARISGTVLRMTVGVPRSEVGSQESGVRKCATRNAFPATWGSLARLFRGLDPCRDRKNLDDLIELGRQLSRHGHGLFRRAIERDLDNDRGARGDLARERQRTFGELGAIGGERVLQLGEPHWLARWICDLHEHNVVARFLVNTEHAELGRFATVTARAAEPRE